MHKSKALPLLAGVTLLLNSCANQSGVSSAPAAGLPEVAAPANAASLSAMALAPLPLNESRSFQVVTPGFTNRSMRHSAGLGGTEVVNAGSSTVLKQSATFRVVAGLADSACVSLQLTGATDTYLRHTYSRVRADKRNNTALFDKDATWCAKSGLAGSGLSLESKNYPGRYLRHRNAELWAEGKRAAESQTLFTQDASWNMVAAWASDGAAPPVTPPPVTQPAPPTTWQEHWYDHDQLVSRVFYDNDLAVYFDKDTDRSFTWMNSYLGDVWRYTKKTYGDFGKDQRLFAVFHTGRYGGGHPATYLDASHDFRNTIVVGAGPWNRGEGNDLDLTTHEVAHIVEGVAKGVPGSPSFGIWKDSKWAEIFNYDVYRGLGRTSDVNRWYNLMIKNSDNFPRANTFWFRDWFYPIYNEHGQTAVLNNYFTLLSQCFVKSGNHYAHGLNWGEFVHFWSGAAGVNLKPQATKAFGWPAEWETQFKKAQSDFSCAQYPR